MDHSILLFRSGNFMRHENTGSPTLKEALHHTIKGLSLCNIKYYTPIYIYIYMIDIDKLCLNLYILMVQKNILSSRTIYIYEQLVYIKVKFVILRQG